MIVPGMFVCSRFLISVCMFIVSIPLHISSATVIVRAGGAIWLNPFATVCLLLCREDGSSPVSLQLLGGGIWAYMRCSLCVSFLGFGIATILTNFHV